MNAAKRNLSILLTTLFLLSVFCHPINTYAASLPATNIGAAFVSNSAVTVGTFSDGFAEINLTQIQEITNSSRSLEGSHTYQATSLTFIAESQTEKDAILSRIEQTRAGGGTIYDEDWFFSNSCYAYISITYTTRNVSNGTEARISSVTTRHSTNSGTTVAKANLHLACIGSSSDTGGTYLEEDINVTTSPYTNTLMNTWPWINTGGPCLGANYTVTARRPSGSTSTHTVSASVFVN